MHAETIYAGTIFSLSAYGFFFRSRHRIIGVAVKVQSSIGEEKKQCHAIAAGGTYREMDEI